MKKPALVLAAVMALSSVGMTAYADFDWTELEMGTCEVLPVPIIYVNEDGTVIDSSSEAEGTEGAEEIYTTFAGYIGNYFSKVYDSQKMEFSGLTKDGKPLDVTLTPETALLDLGLETGYYVFTWTVDGEKVSFAADVRNGHVNFLGKMYNTFAEYFKDLKVSFPDKDYFGSPDFPASPTFNSVIRNGDASVKVFDDETKDKITPDTVLAGLGLPEDKYLFNWYYSDEKYDYFIHVELMVKNGAFIMKAPNEISLEITARDQNKDDSEGGGYISFDSSSDTDSSSGTDSKKDTESTPDSSSDTDSKKDTESTPDSSSDTDSKKDAESTPDSSSDTDSKKDAESTPDSSSDTDSKKDAESTPDSSSESGEKGNNQGGGSGAYVSLGGDGGIYSQKSDKSGSSDSTSGGTGFTAPNVALKAEKTTSGDNKTATTTTTTTTTTTDGGSTTTTTADNNASDTAANGDTANSETGSKNSAAYLLAALSMAAAAVAVKKHPKEDNEN